MICDHTDFKDENIFFFAITRVNLEPILKSHRRSQPQEYHAPLEEGPVWYLENLDESSHC